MSTAKIRKVTVLSILLVNLCAAGEGALSNYFPGAYGGLMPSMAPEPGNVFANVNLFYIGKASRAVAQGQI
ncbi:MAG: hypothetical protein HRU33_10055 [Rhodobacteraceae bacterium]|nr:hypothetical protein [Paracoccaceae bacterium]